MPRIEDGDDDQEQPKADAPKDATTSTHDDEDALLLQEKAAILALTSPQQQDEEEDTTFTTSPKGAGIVSNLPPHAATIDDSSLLQHDSDNVYPAHVEQTQDATFLTSSSVPPGSTLSKPTTDNLPSEWKRIKRKSTMPTNSHCRDTASATTASTTSPMSLDHTERCTESTSSTRTLPHQKLSVSPSVSYSRQEINDIPPLGSTILTKQYPITHQSTPSSLLPAFFNLPHISQGSSTLDEDETEKCAAAIPPELEDHTPTVHAVPVQDNVAFDEQTAEELTDEELIQRLLQQDDEQVLAVVAIPTNPADEEEVRWLRETVQSLHAQLQSQDEQVRQLQHQLESLTSSSSSSTTSRLFLPGGDSSQTQPSQGKHDNNSIHDSPPSSSGGWKRYPCYFLGTSLVVAIIVVVAMVVNGDGRASSSNMDVPSSTGLPEDIPTPAPTMFIDDTLLFPEMTTSPTLVVTAMPTIDNVTMAPSWNTGGATAPAPSRPTFGSPTVEPVFHADPPSDDSGRDGIDYTGGRHESSGEKSIVAILVPTTVAVLLVGVILFFHRCRQNRQVPSTSILPEVLPTTRKDTPTMLTTNQEPQERLKVEVKEALQTAMFSRAQTVRQLQAMLSQKKAFRKSEVECSTNRRA